MIVTSILVSILIILLSVNLLDELYSLPSSPFVYREEEETK